MPFVSDLLTATPATVDGNPTPNRTWQWLRGSTPISGATSNTYTVQEADIGETISVRQTETNLLGSASAFSLATAIVTVFDAYAIGGNSPELVASFLTQEDGTTEGEYFRTGGATDDFTMFTFSRASNATMFDSTGTLKWAPHNLMPSTDNSTEDTRCTITGGQSVTAVLGLTEARLFTQSTGTTEIFHVTRYDLTGAVLGQTYTSSYIVKAGTAPYVFVTHWNTPNARHYSISVDLSDGSVVDTSSSAWTGSHNVEGLGNGYYKIDVTSTSFNIPHLSFSIGFSATSTLDAYGLVYEDGTGVTGYILAEHLYRSDLGGMADNPDQPAGLEKYVPTTSAAVYLPRRNAYYYNGTAWTKGGLQLESRAATQLLHGTDSFATQTETVTAQAYTLQFRGTGSIALTGAHTATLNGTGADALVSLTFTPSAGTLTLTPSGTVDYPQLETGSAPTSYIPNTAGSGTVTRAAETLSIAGVNSPISATEATLAADVLLTSDGLGPEIFNILSGGNWVRVYPRNVASTYAQWRPSYSVEVTSAQGGTISAGINQPVTVALGIKANDFFQLAAQGNVSTALATTTITDFSGRNIGISGNITEGSFFYKSIRVWSTKLPEADLITAGTAS